MSLWETLQKEAPSRVAKRYGVSEELVRRVVEQLEPFDQRRYASWDRSLVERGEQELGTQTLLEVIDKEKFLMLSVNEMTFQTFRDSGELETLTELAAAAHRIRLYNETNRDSFISTGSPGRKTNETHALAGAFRHLYPALANARTSAEIDEAALMAIQQVRPKLFDLRLQFLRTLEESARTESPDNLWPSVSKAVFDALPASVVAEILKVERWYSSGQTDVPIRGEIRLINTGGLLSLLVVAGEMEARIRFRIGHNLATLLDASFPENRPRSYFAITQCENREEIDAALLKTVTDLSAPAWNIEHLKRVNDFLENDLEEIVIYRTKIKRELAPLLRQYLKSLGDLGRSSLEHSGELPPINIVANSRENGQEPEAEENLFRFNGSTWDVRFGGTKETLANRKGMHYIRYLLEFPEKSFHPHELTQLLTRNPTRKLQDGELSVSNSPEGAWHPDYSLDDYRRILRETIAARETAKTEGDSAELHRLDEEVKRIEAAIRLITNADRPNRARKTVGSAIVRALKAIEKVLPELHAHLDNAIKSRHGHPCYHPETKTYWHT